MQIAITTANTIPAEVVTTNKYYLISLRFLDYFTPFSMTENERVTNVCNCHSEDEVRRIYFVTFLQILSHFVAQNDGYFVKFSIFLSLRRTSEQSVKRMTLSIYCHCEDERSEDVAIHCLLICWKLYTFVVILSRRRSICFP